MGNILKEVMVFREYLTCDNEACDNVVMGPGRQSSLGNQVNPGAPQFVHECPKCGDMKTLQYHYPRIVYKELPTVFSNEGNIDAVLGQIEKSMEEINDKTKP